MTEAEIKAEARLMAIERLACHTHNVVIQIFQKLSNMDAKEIDAIEATSLEELRLLPVAGYSPALSDVLSDETYRELSRLVSYAREMRSKASG